MKHASTNVGRPAQVLVLDPPSRLHASAEEVGHASSRQDRCFLPSFSLQSDQESKLKAEVAYISPLLAFNLGLHVTWLEHWRSCRCNLGSQELRKPCLKPSNLEFAKVELCSLHQVLQLPQNHVFAECSADTKHNDEVPLKYAFHVRIGHVKVPTSGLSQFGIDDGNFSSEERQIEVDNALQRYFKANRVLARGDVFAVQLHADAKKGSCQGRFSEDWEDSIMYFKVTEMEPATEPFLLVNCNQTALVLGDSVRSQLPPLMLGPHVEKGPTAWMTPMVDQLARILAPSLHPDAPPLNLRTAVLICGPAGCGKRTVVKHAAKELGIHVVEYNCHELVGPSDGKTVDALIEAFDVARRYAPAVLLLRRFGALGKSHTVGSPAADSAGGISQVGTALWESIRTNLNTMKGKHMGAFSQDINGGHPLFTVRFRGHKPGLVLVVAAVESTETLTPSLRKYFTHEMTMKTPDEQQRLELLCQFLHPQIWFEKDQCPQESLEIKQCLLEQLARTIASQTAGVVPRDLRFIVGDADASMICKWFENTNREEREDVYNVTCQINMECQDRNQEDTSEIAAQTDNSMDIRKSAIERSIQLSVADMEASFERFKSRMTSALGAPKVPNVKWEDVGGLEDAKKAILDTVQLPLLHRDLFASGLRQRSGVLLYGPPGTGKTLLAKAVATECSLNFLSVKGPELINMYIGESEKNVREIFQKARSARPCVIFFDELDALAPARGASGDSGGVMDRVVSQMLAEIDGLQGSHQDLFIIGASNRPDLIDPALLRPGRFDKLLYVGISADVTYRQRVLEALTRKFNLDKDVSLETVARMCPATFTGADMYALCADAWMGSVKRKVYSEQADIEANGSLCSEAIVVNHEDFVEALRELTPSLSEVELGRYERLRSQFEGQKISSNHLINDLD